MVPVLAVILFGGNLRGSGSSTPLGEINNPNPAPGRACFTGKHPRLPARATFPMDSDAESIRPRFMPWSVNPVPNYRVKM
jgi:hypothetical protein